MLIVCEGEKTEPNYFDAIRRQLPPAMIKRITISGEGKNTLSLLREAEEEVRRRKEADEPPYYYVWLVFDRDSFSPSDFDNTIHNIMSRPKYRPPYWRAVWSNEAFELWYVLHFRAQTGGKLSRKRYQKMLEKDMREYIGAN